MKSLHVNTPIWESNSLSSLLGNDVLLKMDCFQPTGSFKIRGIGRLCQEYAQEGTEHIVATSGGNAGYAAAYAARKLGMQATVFVPTPTLDYFIKKIESQGAQVIVSGDTFNDSQVAAEEFLQGVKGGFVSPFNHPLIWEGNSTLMDEVSQQMEKPDGVVVAVGGGGLMCGVLEGLHRIGWGDVKVFGVETQGAAAFSASMKAGHSVQLDRVDTVATSLGSKIVAQGLLDWNDKHDMESLVVTDKDAVLAVKQFLDDHRVLVEPSCGAALASLYRKEPSIMKCKRLLVIVCGGIGITFDYLNQFLDRVGAR